VWHPAIKRTGALKQVITKTLLGMAKGGAVATLAFADAAPLIRSATGNENKYFGHGEWQRLLEAERSGRRMPSNIAYAAPFTMPTRSATRKCYVGEHPDAATAVPNRCRQTAALP